MCAAVVKGQRASIAMVLLVEVSVKRNPLMVSHALLWRRAVMMARTLARVTRASCARRVQRLTRFVAGYLPLQQLVAQLKLQCLLRRQHVAALPPRLLSSLLRVAASVPVQRERCVRRLAMRRAVNRSTIRSASTRIATQTMPITCYRSRCL